MNETVTKLLGMFEEGVKALGAQAGRLYPEVVKLYMWEHILAAVFSFIGFVAMSGICIFLVRKAMAFQPKNSYDDGGVGWFIGSMLSGLGVLVLFGITLANGYSAARVMVAPEAAFILDHIAKLTGK